MTPITWPASLPCLRWEPYSVAPRSGSFEETLGMVTSLSRVYTQNNEVVTCDVVLDASDEPTFRVFYKTTLAMGTQWFNCQILRNGVYELYEVCFIGAPPSFTPIAHNVVKASFTLLTRGLPAPPGPPPPLACPGLSIPIDGSAVGEVTSTTLLWTAVTGATTYRVYVWEDGDPQPVSPTTTTADLTYEITGLTIGLTYRWTVDAVSESGSVSEACESATFSAEEGEATIAWESATFTGDILGASVTLVAVRTGDTSGTASADYDFTEGTALIGPDFVATPGTVTFDPGEVEKEVVVPLVRDYNAEVLDDLSGLAYSGFWPFDDPSPTTSFPDLAGNGFTLTLTSTTGISYEQPDLNLSADKSMLKTGTNSWRFSVDVDAIVGNGSSFVTRGWVKHLNTASVANKSYFQIGGTGGAAQFTYCWCYRNSSGGVSMSWHHDRPNPFSHIFITKNFPNITIGLDEEFWFEAGYDYNNERAFFRKNNEAVEYITWDDTDKPDGLILFDSRVTYFSVGQRRVGNAGDMINGYFSDYEFVVGADMPMILHDRYTRWNLDASLNFTATLSNPAGAVLGAIDETVMTIEAP
jgi:hypothetical protein